MYKINPNNNQSEWHFDMNKFIQPFFNICRTYNLDSNGIRFYSQQDEDKNILQYILKEKLMMELLLK